MGSRTFEFATATRIVFGAGKANELSKLVSGSGKNPLVVTGRNTSRAQACMGAEFPFFNVSGEPTVQDITEGVRVARDHQCDMVVGFGGGGAIDAGKAIAALLTNKGEVLDYLEVVGKGQAISHRPRPFVAVPTTAGTGAEVTRNAVVKSTEHQVKASMRSPLMLPDVAVVDPVLTMSMPAAVTASTGLDALTQLIEAFVTKKSHALTDGLCREAIPKVANSLQRAVEDGSDLAARSEMCVGSLFSGLALANAGLGAVHGFAGPLGGMFEAPHGMVCAALLPAVFEANAHAVKDSGVRSKFNELGALLTGSSQASATDAVSWIRQTCKALEVPGLASVGITEADIPTIVEKSKNASSMKGNPVPLSDEVLSTIVYQSL